MNKIITSLLFFSFFFTTIFIAKVHAQASAKLTLVEYETTEELNSILPLSQRALTYLNGEDFETGIVLALMSDENIRAVKDKKYSVEILDESPVLDRYVLLYHPSKNKADLLKDLGQVRQITPYHTLLKLDENKEFTHEGVGAQFFESPFADGITPPPNATPVLPETVGTNQNSSSQDNGTILFIAIVLTFLLGIGLGTFLYLKKRKESNSSF